MMHRTLMLAIAATIVSGACGCATTATERYLLPSDAYGWMEVRWGVHGAAHLAREHAFRVAHVPETGIVETCEDIGTTSSPGEYYYVDSSGGRTRAPLEGGGFTFQGYGRRGRISSFIFIGTEAEARKAERRWPMAKDGVPVPGLRRRVSAGAPPFTGP
jgi:hypothetical protein